VSGEVFKEVLIPILNDTAVETAETFTLTLRNPSVPGTLGSVSNANVTIVSDDCVVGFSAAAFSVNENVAGGFAVIGVVRSGGTNGTVSVGFFTPNGGTATAGLDYATTSGTLTFAPGEVSKSFTVPIVNDVAVEGNETVLLQLSNPTGPATL